MYLYCENRPQYGSHLISPSHQTTAGLPWAHSSGRLIAPLNTFLFPGKYIQISLLVNEADISRPCGSWFVYTTVHNGTQLYTCTFNVSSLPINLIATALRRSWPAPACPSAKCKQITSILVSRSNESAISVSTRQTARDAKYGTTGQYQLLLINKTQWSRVIRLFSGIGSDVYRWGLSMQWQIGW